MVKDKKAKAAQKKARVAAKTEKKAAKTEKKSKAKFKDDDSDAEGEADLDAVLAEYAKQQEAFLKVSETVSTPPTARGSATLIGSPANTNELFLFGGEYFNGQHARFFNDLFIYNIARSDWKLVTSPNTPLPRSGHAWTRGGNDKGIYLFGGEFSSPKQGTFYHYNDFWRLEPATREWAKIEGKKGPPARSGHRMTCFKQYVLLFGGFQDTSQQTKYLNDLWIYDTERFEWHQPALPPASAKPDARSSFSFLPHEQGAVIYGGYSRVKTTGAAGGKGGRGGGGAQHAVLKPMVHQDTWFLRITPPPADAPPNALPTVRWERRKRPANPPTPARAGATMAHHRGRGIQFGGVHDVEESEEGIDSEFFNTLFAWNIERNRYFSLNLRKARAAPKRPAQGADRGGRRGRGKADEEELLRSLAALETKGTLNAEGGKGEVTAEMPAEEEEDERDAPPEKPVLWEMPHARFNAALAVQDDTLYIYGGTFEKGDREYTFDEMYAIDLGKLDGVKEVFRREPEDWQGSEDEDSDEEDEEEDDEDASEDEQGDEASSITRSKEAEVPASLASTAPTSELADTDEAPSSTSDSALSDNLPHPRPFETLRDFFGRTSNAWQDVLIDELKYVYDPEHKSIKELRKDAFDRAEAKWWDCREEIRQLEDEAEEAGIGEVVSLEEKQAGSGAGRRR